MELCKTKIKEMVAAYDISNELEENNGQLFNYIVEMIEKTEYTCQFYANIFHADCDGNIGYKVLDKSVDIWYNEDDYVTLSASEFESIIN